MTPGEPQASDAVLMVRPAHFEPNEQTAGSNFFQRDAAARGIAEAAQREFDALVLAVEDAGVRVLVYAGQAEQRLPDELFPNNWLSLHADGTAVLYPLLAPVRRLERRMDLLNLLEHEHRYHIERVIDLTTLEERSEFLEGTGSLVLDRPNRVAYACLSPRTTESALAEFCRQMGYEPVAFCASDRKGRAIYHTNVLMSVGTWFAACCTPAIAEAQRGAVVERLAESGRELVALSFEELENFAGNVLELRGRDGPIIVISQAALTTLAPATRRALERHGTLVAADVSTIERVGGGSVRCMLTEVALPPAGQRTKLPPQICW